MSACWHRRCNAMPNCVGKMYVCIHDTKHGNRSARVHSTRQTPCFRRPMLSSALPLKPCCTHLSDHEHVHAVQLEARDVVAHGVVGGVRRGSLLGRSHAVLVVLDAVDHRQLCCTSVLECPALGCWGCGRDLFFKDKSEGAIATRRDPMLANEYKSGRGRRQRFRTKLSRTEGSRGRRKGRNGRSVKTNKTDDLKEGPHCNGTAYQLLKRASSIAQNVHDCAVERCGRLTRPPNILPIPPLASPIGRL